MKISFHDFTPHQIYYFKNDWIIESHNNQVLQLICVGKAFLMRYFQDENFHAPLALMWPFL